MAVDYVRPNSTNLRYGIREHSVDKGAVSLGRETGLSGSAHSLLLDNSYHDNPVVSKELRIEGN